MAEIIKYVSLANLQKYDEKIKSHINEKDAALKENLEGQIEVVAGALDSEITRAKAAEATNAAAAEAAQTHSEGLAAKVGTVPEGSTVMGIINNIQENAYDDTEVRGLISDLDTNKADKTQVATDIADAVKAEEDARKEAVSGVQGAVDALSQTHATDKSALEGAIALKADQTALDAVSEVANAAATKTALQEEVNRATGEEARIEGLVTAEAERAAGVEAGLDERLVEVETFFKTAEGETLDTALDTLVEIQKYVTDEGAAADQMVKDIAANAKAIEDMDAAYKLADQNLQSAIDLKADASDLEALDGRVGTLETNSATKTELGEVSTALTEYKDAHKDDYTNAQIDAAIKVNTDAIAALNDTYASDEELAQAIEDEVSRADGAYAAKSLETTVSDHMSDTVSHITADERTAWNKVADKADQTALQGEIDRATAKEAELQAAIDAFEECSVADIEGLFA